MRHASHTSPLIGPAELRALQLDASQALVVVDCRHDLARPAWGREQYEVSHIPGAVHAHLDTDLSAPITPATGRHPLPDATEFAARLAAWGIAPDTLVVAYDQDSSMYAVRLWWLLRASGHARVAVLDGGFAAWMRAGLPVDATPVTLRAGKALTAPAPFSGALGTAEVQPLLARREVLLVDARPADRFAGRNEVVDPVPGHIPGAVSHPVVMNLQPDKTFLPPEALRAHWLAFLGERPVTQVVAMCGSGVTACHNLLALELAGLPGARLYAGSYSEWIRDAARPVVTGPASGDY